MSFFLFRRKAIILPMCWDDQIAAFFKVGKPTSWLRHTLRAPEGWRQVLVVCSALRKTHEHRPSILLLVSASLPSAPSQLGKLFFLKVCVGVHLMSHADIISALLFFCFFPFFFFLLVCNSSLSSPRVSSGRIVGIHRLAETVLRCTHTYWGRAAGDGIRIDTSKTHSSKEERIKHIVCWMFQRVVKKVLKHIKFNIASRFIVCCSIFWCKQIFFFQ